MSQPVFYQTVTPATTSYVWYPFGFATKKMITIVAEKTNTANIDFSFDGVTLHGELERGEPINLPEKRATGIYIKGASGSQSFRLWAF